MARKVSKKEHIVSNFSTRCENKPQTIKFISFLKPQK